jgi:tetrahydromethanopterin S-methyltransferase subunit F
MTAKEKAKQLVEKFIEHTQEWDEIDGYVNDVYNSKQCALIAVDECLKTCVESMIYYWQEVKQEIQNL